PIRGRPCAVVAAWSLHQDPAPAGAFLPQAPGGDRQWRPGEAWGMTPPNIVEFVTDPQLLGLSISAAQETLLRAIYGLPMSSDHLDLFRACTGRQEPPRAAFAEATVIAGARAGKDSRIAAPLVVYEAVFGGHERHLARGERGVIPLVAQDARG